MSEKKKVRRRWCRHIRWERLIGDVYGWTFTPDRSDVSRDVIATGWNCCPMCKADRPDGR